MKNTQFVSSLSRKALLFGMAVLLALGSLLAAPVMAAQAAEAVPATASALSAAYKHDQAWLAVQQTNLDKANAIVPVLQDLITQANSLGLDTSALSAALAVYQGQLATAQASHSSAADVLAAHAGFDDSGNVTDRAAAAQTVLDATKALTDTHIVLVQSMQDLLAAVKAFAKANPIFDKTDALQVSFLNEQAWLTGQQANLDKSAGVVSDVQNLISVAQANNLKTGLLSGVLSGFQAKTDKAQAAHASAEAILAAHAGFDDSGDVTNVGEATKTIKDAGKALMDAHNFLSTSTKTLLAAVDAWRILNHVNPASPVHPAWSQAHASLAALNKAVSGEGGLHTPGLLERLNNLLKVLSGEL